MTTGLAAVLLVAVLACPVHMLWRMRRGESASCAPDLAADEVGRRQARLAERLARMGAERG